MALEDGKKLFMLQEKNAAAGLRKGMWTLHPLPSSVDKGHVIGVWELPASEWKLGSGWELGKNNNNNK